MSAQVTNQKFARRPLQIVQFINSRPASLPAIKQQCKEHVSNLGYQYFSYEGYYPLCEKRHEISTFPTDWLALNSHMTIASDNPISTFTHNKTTPFFWNDLRKELNSNTTNLDSRKSALEALLESAYTHNIHGGVSFPIHGAGSEIALFSIARKYKMVNPPLKTLRSLQLIAMTVHDAVKRANMYEIKEQNNNNTLSPRELECLGWIAAGKTAWETGKIIGITESTVSFHIRNTIKKLNTTNRAHAVAVAIARSLIKPTIL